MILQFKKPTNTDIEDFLTWKYSGDYSFYDNNVSQEKMDFIQGFIDSENDFSIFDQNNGLIGNCSFYYIDEFFCMGLQLRPDLTGNGMGNEFVSSILDFAKEKYNLAHIDLTVAKFNKRAVRVYEKLGFALVEEFVNTIGGRDYDFVAMRYCYER